MEGTHLYNLKVVWTGNLGKGTSSYRSYERSHKVIIEDKEEIHCSSDPAFRGDSKKHNPEELFIASISSCHMLWYLHLCAEKGVNVLEYIDEATGTMQETKDGGGHFTDVILHPTVIIEDPNMIKIAESLHKEANRLCFIANSCNFQIHHQPLVKTT